MTESRPVSMREAIINTNAITENVRCLKKLAGVTEFIAVAKADGYGHGAADTARAAIKGGATRIGTADLHEALALVRQGITGVPLVAWLHPPKTSFEDAAAAGIEIGISNHEQLEAAAAAREAVPTSVHIKLETGLGRGGAASETWPGLLTRAWELQELGRVRVVGLFSHLSGTSREDDLEQLSRFENAIDIAHRARLDPPLLHLAATAATISLPETRFNAVRVGLGIYGLSPLTCHSSADLGLRPAMTLRAEIAAIRRVGVGQGVSYDYTYRTRRPATLALVPLGYADGIPRQASSAGHVTLNGRRYQVAGRVAMDQFVIDVGDDPVSVGGSPLRDSKRSRPSSGGPSGSASSLRSSLSSPWRSCSCSTPAAAREANTSKRSSPSSSA